MSTYFIKSGSWIKIGKSANPGKRFLALQGASPTPLALMKVAEIPESEAHKTGIALSKRGNGEWFEATEQLEQWVESLPVSPDESDVRKAIAYAANGVGRHLRMKPKKAKGGKRGRPATGSTKIKPSITIDIRLMARIRIAAAKQGISVSAFFENALREHLKKVAP